MTMSAGTLLGLLGVVLVCTSFAMRHMFRLRSFALLGNVCFLGYGFLEWQIPALIVNAILLPLNVRALCEIARLSKELRRAGHDAPISQWLLPHMRHRRFSAGEVLFRRGEPAGELVYVAAGRLRALEKDQPIAAGEFVGEIGLFSPQRRRTQTVICDTDGELYYMTGEMIHQLYYKNPKLGLYLMQRVVERLLSDVDSRPVIPAPA